MNYRTEVQANVICHCLACTPLFEIEHIKYWSHLWFFSTTWASLVVAKSPYASKIQTNKIGGNKLLLGFKLTFLENYEKCPNCRYTFASVEFSLSNVEYKTCPYMRASGNIILCSVNITRILHFTLPS
jgi:hypothetical protein